MSRETLCRIANKERLVQAVENARDIATRVVYLPFAVTYISFLTPRADLIVNAPSRRNKYAQEHTNEDGSVFSIILPNDTSVAIVIEQTGQHLVVQDYVHSVRGGELTLYSSIWSNRFKFGRKREIQTRGGNKKSCS